MRVRTGRFRRIRKVAPDGHLQSWLRPRPPEPLHLLRCDAVAEVCSAHSLPTVRAFTAPPCPTHYGRRLAVGSEEARLRAGLRPPLKLHVRFSRMQLLRRRMVPSCNRRYQSHQIHQPQPIRIETTCKVVSIRCSRSPVMQAGLFVAYGKCFRERRRVPAVRALCRERSAVRGVVGRRFS